MALLASQIRPPIFASGGGDNVSSAYGSPGAPADSRPGSWRLTAAHAVFVVAVALGCGAAFLLWPLPPLDSSRVGILGLLSLAALTAEVFTVDFPDRRRVSVSYMFALLASSIVDPSAGMIVAGSAGLIAGLARPAGCWWRGLFHGPRLALAAAAGSYVTAAALGGLRSDLSVPALAGLLSYAAIFTLVAWSAGWLEELLSRRPGRFIAVDPVTNALIVPLPLVLQQIYQRTGASGLQFSVLALALLLIVVRAYVNLATLHATLKAAYARLAEQEQKLARALESNREMSQIVSHDLRGPLTSVMGYTELLRSSLARPAMQPERQIGYVESIERNSRRILNLADNLLNLHRLEEGADLELACVNPADVVRKVVDEMSVRAAQKRIALQARLDGLPMNTSEWMLREIVDNLLSNAIKYTPEGGHVDVRVARHEAELLIEVGDDGIGMSPEDQAKLFTKFFRSGAAEVRKAHGSGLGLALTRKLVERLGGEIEVRSELGAGSRFRVRLRVQQ